MESKLALLRIILIGCLSLPSFVQGRASMVPEVVDSCVKTHLQNGMIEKCAYMKDGSTCGTSDVAFPVNTTVSGHKCQAWKSEEPHGHTLAILGQSDTDNRCFSNEDSRPWCYTMERDIRWEYCYPTCGDNMVHGRIIGENCALEESQCGYLNNSYCDFHFYCDCDGGFTEHEDGNCVESTETQDSGPCRKNEFECGNQRCIDLSWKCDGEEDCATGEDEKGCPDPNIIGTSCEGSDPKCQEIQFSFCNDSALCDCYPGHKTEGGFCVPAGPVAFCLITDIQLGSITQCVETGNSACATSDVAFPATQTVSGRECQAWRSEHPHGTKYAGLGKSDTDNRCFSNDASQPWCYTTDPKKPWEYCYPNCDCEEDEFDCGGHICVSSSGICDGKQDCPNADDEADCV